MAGKDFSYGRRRITRYTTWHHRPRRLSYKKGYDKSMPQIRRKMRRMAICYVSNQRRVLWPQEVPSAAERANAIFNLEKNNNKVDFILSHEAPASDLALLSHRYYKPTEYSKFLEIIHSTVDYKGYLFGHYHVDKIINEKDMCLYENIIRIS